MQEYLDIMRTLVLRSGITEDEFELLNKADEDDINTLFVVYWKPAQKEYESPCLTEPEKADEYWRNADAVGLENDTRRRLNARLRELGKESLYLIRQAKRV